MYRLLCIALVAGLVSGLFVFTLQYLKLTPMILEAERYEQQLTAVSDGHHHEHDEDTWEPAPGMQRAVVHLLASLGMAVGFALLLVGMLAWCGGEVGPQRGLLWGMAGFTVFSLAPSFGLPPELPGSLGAPVLERQLWWCLATGSTALGLAAVFLTKKSYFMLAGMALLLLPHLVGAPQFPMGGVVPPELSAAFASASLSVMAAFWVVLGIVSGFCYRRFSV